MSETAGTGSLVQFGWRLGIAVVIIVGGYAALLLIPLVVAADLEPELKAALTGLLGLTPLLTKLAAVAILGKPAFNLIKQQVIRRLQLNSNSPLVRFCRTALRKPGEVWHAAGLRGTQSIPASFQPRQTQIGIFSMSSTGQTFRGQPRVGGKAAAEFLRDMTAGMGHEERLAQVRWLARLMDDNFRVPGTRLRFGWDSVLGLFPGLGDLLTSAISLLIVHHAWQTGASKLTLARMLANVGVDFVVGAIPFLGDLFDFAFKANRRNARLLEQHFDRQAKRRIRSRSA